MHNDVMGRAPPWLAVTVAASACAASPSGEATDGAASPRWHAHAPVSPDLPLAIAVPTTLEQVMLDGLLIRIRPIEIDAPTWVADLRAHNVSLSVADATPTDEGWTVTASGAGARFVGWLRPLGAIAIECIADASDSARSELLRKTCFETQPATDDSGEPELYIPFAIDAQRAIVISVEVPGEPEQVLRIESAATAPVHLREPASFRLILGSIIDARVVSDGWAILGLSSRRSEYSGTSRRTIGAIDVVCSADDRGGGEPQLRRSMKGCLALEPTR